MKPIRWSRHALKSLADREVPRPEADKALTDPDLVTPSGAARQVFMRRYFDARLQQPMLVRVIVEETPNEQVVTPVYITSKISKYIKGAQP